VADGTSVSFEGRWRNILERFEISRRNSLEFPKAMLASSVRLCVDFGQSQLALLRNQEFTARQRHVLGDWVAHAKHNTPYKGEVK